jgi:hypothetical protein
MEYKIKPVKTLYKNIYFRSRLEATWACFFDRLGWQWEYEPFDLDGWFPDFLIKTEFGDKKELLVEVKPYDLKNLSVEAKEKIHQILNILPNGKEFLLLGRAPFRTDNMYDENENFCIGYLAGNTEIFDNDDRNIDEALLNFVEDKDFSCFDVCDVLQSYVMRMSGHYEGNQYPAKSLLMETIWGECKRTVQYRYKK